MVHVLKTDINRTAAALTSINQDQETEHLIVVLDIGGGTVDVSIIQYENFIHEVSATVGNTTLGGEDFNMRLYSLFMNEYAKRKRKPLSTSRYGHQLKRGVKRAKIELSKHDKANIDIISDVVEDEFTMRVTKQQFEIVCEDLIQSILDLVLKAMRLADVKTSEITDVLIVGGSSKIPAVRDMLYNLFMKKPTEFVNPDLAVLHGATIQASIIKQETVTNEITMIDVFPYTLGIETEEHKIFRIISKNTNIPTFTTRELWPPQKSNSKSSFPAIKIYRGDFENAKDNEFLGEFSLNEVPKNGKIVVRFEIDVNGIVKVSARYYTRVRNEWLPTDVSNEATLNGMLHKMQSTVIQRKQKLVENFWQQREQYMRRKQNEATMELKGYKITSILNNATKTLDAIVGKGYSNIQQNEVDEFVSSLVATLMEINDPVNN